MKKNMMLFVAVCGTAAALNFAPAGASPVTVVGSGSACPARPGTTTPSVPGAIVPATTETTTTTQEPSPDVVSTPPTTVTTPPAEPEADTPAPTPPAELELTMPTPPTAPAELELETPTTTTTPAELDLDWSTTAAPAPAELEVTPSTMISSFHAPRTERSPELQPKPVQPYTVEFTVKKDGLRYDVSLTKFSERCGFTSVRFYTLGDTTPGAGDRWGVSIPELVDRDCTAKVFVTIAGASTSTQITVKDEDVVSSAASASNSDLSLLFLFAGNIDGARVRVELSCPAK